jgi:glutamate dehydrogenase/leucine dehydrogenase
VPTNKLSTVDGFVVIDLPDAPVSTGIVRRAPTILSSGAADLARSLTYAYASLGMPRGGASAGINATDANGPAAIAAFVAEVAPMVAAGTFLPDPGKGVDGADLAPLAADDPRVPVSAHGHDELVAAGVLAAAEHAVGGLEGRGVAIEGFGPASRPLVAELLAHGARIVAVSTAKGCVADPAGLAALELAKGAGIAAEGAQPGFKVLGVDCDVLFVGSKMGAVDHTGAAFVQATAVVPLAPLPVTAKALAVLHRAGVAVYPDFVVLAGPLLAAWGPPGRDDSALRAETAGTVRAMLDEVAGHADGVLLASCYRAESFLRSWRDDLPFGRPLAA